MSILFRSFIICNTQYAYKMEQQEILQRFRNSHYTQRALAEANNKTTTKYNIPTSDNQLQYAQSRRIALNNIGTKHKPNSAEKQKIFLPMTHWPNLPYHTHINKTNWPLKLNQCKVKGLQPTISYKQPANLLRLLTNAST